MKNYNILADAKSDSFYLKTLQELNGWHNKKLRGIFQSLWHKPLEPHLSLRRENSLMLLIQIFSAL